MPNDKRGRGRPTKAGKVRIQLKLSLHEQEDADLITWFQQIPEGQRSKAVITALRQGKIEVSEPTHNGAEGEDLVADDDFEAMLELL